MLFLFLFNYESAHALNTFLIYPSLWSSLIGIRLPTDPISCFEHLFFPATKQRKTLILTTRNQFDRNKFECFSPSNMLLTNILLFSILFYQFHVLFANIVIKTKLLIIVKVLVYLCVEFVYSMFMFFYCYYFFFTFLSFVFLPKNRIWTQTKKLKKFNNNLMLIRFFSIFYLVHFDFLYIPFIRKIVFVTIKLWMNFFPK